MTLPDERTRAIQWARKLLLDLLNPKKTPKVPRNVRVRAASVLRHFPGLSEIDRVAKQNPDVFGRIEKDI